MLLKHAQYLTRQNISKVSVIRFTSCQYHVRCTTLPLLETSRPSARPRALPQLCSVWHKVHQHRGARKKAAVALDDVPQGLLPGNPLPPLEDAEPEYPPLLQQVRNNMLKFSHCVLLTRVGGFYEVINQRRLYPLLTVSDVLRTCRRVCSSSGSQEIEEKGCQGQQEATGVNGTLHIHLCYVQYT